MLAQAGEEGEMQVMGLQRGLEAVTHPHLPPLALLLTPLWWPGLLVVCCVHSRVALVPWDGHRPC